MAPLETRHISYHKNQGALSKILLSELRKVSYTFLEVSLLARITKFYNHCRQKNWVFPERMLIGTLLVLSLSKSLATSPLSESV